MNLFKKRVPLLNATDSNLVMYSLGGDRDAFCQIVTRYQNLLCSLAYSSVGDLKYSEDIAQDTFVEAWKKLDTLQDPEKLKAWLCGILKFKISHFRRKEKTQPIQSAQDIDSSELLPEERTNTESNAIDEQHQALLWKVLDQIDDTYREPLILFYREQQSIERVAEELDLSKDTVKQRLSRGRKLLQQAMSSFVEEALTSTKPGVAFTAGVMTLISSIAPPAAKAATIGASAAKTSSVIGTTAVFAFLASISGLISSFFGIRASLDQSRTERERKLAIQVAARFITVAVLYVGGVFALRQLAIASPESAASYALMSQIIVFAFVFIFLFLVCRMAKVMRETRIQERIFNPDAFQREVDKPNAKQREYKSKLTLAGVPLIHIQFGTYEQDDAAAFGWIAGGNRARGLLFAWGAVAIAPISVGILSVGVITIGAVGVGLFSMGTVAIGVIGFGSSAIAYKAYGGLSALGWESAGSGGFAIAKEAAVGTIALAEQVNNEIAAEVVHFAFISHYLEWILAAIFIFVVVPSAWHSSKVRKRMK